MASYTAEEIRLNSEPVRDAVYTNRIRLEGWIKLLCLIAFAGFAVFTYLLINANASNEEMKSRVDRLVWRQYQLDMSVDTLNAQVEGISLQQKRDVLDLSQKLVSTQPTAVPDSLLFTIKYEFVGNKIGQSFKLVIRGIDGSTGLSKEQAEKRIKDEIGVVQKACPSGAYGGAIVVGLHASYMGTGDSSYRVSPACWEVLEEITGQKPWDRLPTEAVTALRQHVGVGTDITVYVGANGKIVGYWRNSLPPTDTACFEKAMRVVGWDGTPYFPVTVTVQGDSSVDKIFYDYLVHWYAGPRIPDFCGAGSLTRINQPPTWVGYILDNDGVHHIHVEEKDRAIIAKMTLLNDARYYTNLQYKIEVEGVEKSVMVGDDDLIQINAYPSSLVNLPEAERKIQYVYLRFRRGQAEWFVPKGGSQEDHFILPAVQLSPVVDGVGPWFYSRNENPWPYLADGMVSFQRASWGSK